MLEFSEKYFKALIIKMQQGKMLLKDEKSQRRHRENKEEPNKNLKTEKKITKIKNLLVGLNNRMEMAECHRS